ncbi:hypothetical protein ACSQ6I_19405 [Anabaena sp. WFMT]|uniref:hypothetical protein n=1 Tax=Anabaena sp. WFMT TaxID=3449730 RepID=UPI003F205E3B
MSLSKEVVIFIPGWSPIEKGYYLSCLTDGLTQQLENIEIKEIETAKVGGYSGKRFQVNLNNNIKNVDIYEVFWLDLTCKLSDVGLKEKLIGGTSLFFYWIFSKIWLSATKYPLLFQSFVSSIFLLICWYYGTIVMALTAIGQDNTILGFALDKNFATQVGELGKYLGGWSIWLILSALINFFPVNTGIDISYFTMKFLDQDTDGKVIRSKIRSRLSEIVYDLVNENFYSKITILSHSWGVVVATDFVADYHKDQALRHITLGGPLAILSYRSEWIDEEIKKCVDNEKLESWTDFYSDQDWLSTKTPFPQGSTYPKIQSFKNKLKFDLIKQLRGKTHLSYFTDEQVLKTILNL